MDYFLVISPDKSYANAHPSIKFRDGNATGNNYDPMDVDPEIKKRWENDSLSDFVVEKRYHKEEYNLDIRQSILMWRIQCGKINLK